MKLTTAIKVASTASSVFYLCYVVGVVDEERKRLAALLAESEARARVLERTLIHTANHLQDEDVPKLRSVYENEREFERIIQHVK